MEPPADERSVDDPEIRAAHTNHVTGGSSGLRMAIGSVASSYQPRADHGHDPPRNGVQGRRPRRSAGRCVWPDPGRGSPERRTALRVGGLLILRPSRAVSVPLPGRPSPSRCARRADRRAGGDGYPRGEFDTPIAAPRVCGDRDGVAELTVATFVGRPDGSEWLRDEVGGDAQAPAGSVSLPADVGGGGGRARQRRGQVVPTIRLNLVCMGTRRGNSVARMPLGLSHQVLKGKARMGPTSARSAF